MKSTKFSREQIKKILLRMLSISGFKTQKELAKFFGIGDSAIGNWYRDEAIPNIHLEKFYKEFKVSEGELLEQTTSDQINHPKQIKILEGIIEDLRAVIKDLREDKITLKNKVKELERKLLPREDWNGTDERSGKDRRKSVGKKNR